MLVNWIRIFFRVSARHRGFTLLNLFGLSVGISAALLALLFVRHELSYDRFHEDADRIYTVSMHLQVGGSDFWTTGVPEPVVVGVAESVPGVISSGMIDEGSLIARKGTELLTLDQGYRVTENFFDVFTYPLAVGETGSFYGNPDAIILTSESANRLFGDSDPVGKAVEEPTTKRLFTVAGVLAPIPEASSLEFDYLLPRPPSTLEAGAWRSLSTKIFFKIPERQDIGEVEESITNIIRENSTLPAHFLQAEKLFQASPLTGQHLGHITGTDGWVMNYSGLYGVGSLGGIILLLAIINYINLTTARGLTRAREVGMRKTLGGTRSVLVFQFLAESMLLVAAAMLVALVLTETALPLFQQMVQRSLDSAYLVQPWFIASALGLVLLIGLISGAAPALVISAYPSIEVMKGRLVTSRRGTFFRSVLVIGQFVITIGLLGAMTTIHRQLNYLQAADLGFDQDQICFLPLHSSEGGTPFAELKKEMLAIPGVEYASLSSSAPFCGNLAMAVNYDEETETTKSYYSVESDEDFADVFGLELLQGRLPTASDYASSSSAVIITENSIEAFDIGPDPLGKKLDEDAFEVIGVVADFLANSAQFEQYPIVLTPPDRDPEVLLLRLTPGQIRTTVNAIENSFTRLYPNQPFEIDFLDDRVQKSFESERNLSKMVSVFTGVALLVAILGLYGLSLYTTVLRTKEIGVRKILGASSLRVAGLLTSQHLRQVLIAIVIATPLTWWLMTKWLEDYSYRISLSWDLLLLPALAGLVTGLGAVIAHTWRAATANPADSIRSE